MQELSVVALKLALEGAQPPLVLDVRERWEWVRCHLDGALHMPLAELPRRVHELDRARPTAVLCHHGVRSFQAAHYLAQQGFVQISNVTGGIDAWAREVDPDLPVY